MSPVCTTVRRFTTYGAGSGAVMHSGIADRSEMRLRARFRRIQRDWLRLAQIRSIGAEGLLSSGTGTQARLAVAGIGEALFLPGNARASCH